MTPVLKDVEDVHLHIHDWCKEGKYKEVEKYITTCTNPSRLLGYQRGVFGYTPLHVAVTYNRPKMVQLLLDHGGDVNCRSNGGYTPLHLAAFTGHVSCVCVLLKYNADISATDDYNKTPIHTAQQATIHTAQQAKPFRSQVLQVLRSAGKLKCHL